MLQNGREIKGWFLRDTITMNMAPTCTEKPGKVRKQGILNSLEKSGNFTQNIEKNEGILTKILEKWGNFSHFLFFFLLFNWSVFVQ